MSLNLGVGRHGDFIIDRNVPDVHVVHANAVALLANRRVFLQLLDLRALAAIEPTIGDDDFPCDANTSRRAGTDDDVAGTGEYLQISLAADLVGTFESPLHIRSCEAEGSERQQKCQQTNDCGLHIRSWLRASGAGRTSILAATINCGLGRFLVVNHPESPSPQPDVRTCLTGVRPARLP